MEEGKRASMAAGRIGRATRFPLQFGQVPPSRVSTQSAQKVHSKVQMRASGLSGGRSRSQHSQLGRRLSMGVFSNGSGPAGRSKGPRFAPASGRDRPQDRAATGTAAGN